MKSSPVTFLSVLVAIGAGLVAKADEPAKVTEAVNIVGHGTTAAATAPATAGTLIHDGEYVKTGASSRAEMKLPSTTITRLGAYTIYNYSVESNTVDLRAGTILFCKPKDAPRLNIKTEAVTAGITGTTGFVSVHTVNGKTTYTLGLIEGHAVAFPKGNPPFPLGPGDIVQFTPGSRPFSFAYDVPRFVKSSPLLKNFKGTLPNQSAIDHELAEYADDVSRGFIVPPSKAIDYTGQIPVLSTVAYSSAQNANQPHAASAPPPPPPSGGRGSPFGSH